MNITSASESKASPLWEYAAIADYRPPAAPVTQAARTGLAVFRHLFRRSQTEQDSPVKTQEELKALPRDRLERIAPPLEWGGAAEALDVELGCWLGAEKPNEPTILLVGPPYGGHAQILAAWAEGHSWRQLKPPSPEQVLAGDESWLFNQASDGDPWVLTALERTYLRHATGLSLIRRFLDRAAAGDLGRGIIGCDSWAWAFVRVLWRGRPFITMTLQAFDHSKLADCFQGLAESFSDRPPHFRQSNNGQYVLSPGDKEEVVSETSNFLKLLAAESRGILGVAWAMWRASLRSKPDEMRTEQSGGGDHRDARHTVWVTPWNQLKFPSLPGGAGRDEAFVLHALLLHNGLPVECLQKLLPLSPSQVVETIFRLDEAGLLVRHNALWRVSPQGYPVVRQFLKSNGYLVDQF